MVNFIVCPLYFNFIKEICPVPPNLPLPFIFTTYFPFLRGYLNFQHHRSVLPLWKVYIKKSYSMYSNFLYLVFQVVTFHNLKFFHYYCCLIFHCMILTILYLSILLMMNIRLVSTFGLVLFWIFFMVMICHSTVF